MKQCNNNNPLISIIMPVYNAGDFLVEAIESIINQTYENWELICVDDKSKDNSLKILNELAFSDSRIKVLKNRSNKGISFSLNKAIKKAQGDFIARMDADDISLFKRLEKQVNFLQKNPDIISVGGQVEIINNQGNFLFSKKFPVDSKICYEQIMKMTPLQHACLMAKAEVLKKYQYNEKISTAEDMDMFFYLLNKGKISNIKDTVYQYRKVDSSNGYHSVKKTFYITFYSRIKSIFKYGYKPSLSGLLFSLGQFVLVSCLPGKWVVQLFEALRFTSAHRRPRMAFANL